MGLKSNIIKYETMIARLSKRLNHRKVVSQSQASKIGIALIRNDRLTER